MGESIKLWRCPRCNRVLREANLEQARERHSALVERSAAGAVDFVREATWGAYLASLRRCRCGSKSKFRPLPGIALRGHLALGLDPVVIQ
jgi:hypothetical protein